MKTKILSLVILALAASFNASAQDAAADLNPPAVKDLSNAMTVGAWPQSF